MSAEPIRRLALRQSLETYVAIAALAAILANLVMRFALSIPAPASDLPLYVALLFGGLPLLVVLARKMLARDFGSDLLAGVSIATAVLLHEYLVGCIVVLMLSGGQALEQYATKRASSILEALARRMPNVAHRSAASAIVDVQLNDVKIDDSLIVMPHELCPVDGVVIEGHGWMDESYLTGEPYRTSKAPGSQVLSGAINGNTVLSIKALKLAADSRYSRIMRVMQEAEERRPRLRRLGDQLGAWYTPIALAIATFGWLISGSAVRFLSVVVIATPCPLLLGIPIAIIGAISLAARKGIIIKNPTILERIGSCRTMIFDKTGTLTYGRPILTEVLCDPGFTRTELLTLAATLEQYSKHPLAQAILDAAKADGVRFSSAVQVSENPGAGLRALIDGRSVEITGRQALTKAGRPFPPSLPPAAQGLESLVFVDDIYAATLRFRDEPRADSHSFIEHLAPRHRVDRIMILSGDRDSEVRYLADRVGITDVQSGKGPEDKVAIVREQTERAPTMFIGDGINDAPAMQSATVGLAFGQNSDITSEAADAVIMEPSLRKVDELIHIALRMRAIAMQSAVGGMALSFVGMAAAVAGYLPPVVGAVAQELIDVAAVLNAVRVAFPRGELADF